LMRFMDPPVGREFRRDVTSWPLERVGPAGFRCRFSALTFHACCQCVALPQAMMRGQPALSRVVAM
ncbi:MAG TPA: hypothetical protein VJQ42_08435, partial [Rhodanobacteraceae bacterium]|nr:hypothetical protein [Rhodanobacteraceae bacterium]